MSMGAAFSMIVGRVMSTANLVDEIQETDVFLGFRLVVTRVHCLFGVDSSLDFSEFAGESLEIHVGTIVRRHKLSLLLLLFAWLLSIMLSRPACLAKLLDH